MSNHRPPTEEELWEIPWDYIYHEFYSDDAVTESQIVYAACLENECPLPDWFVPGDWQGIGETEEANQYMISGNSNFGSSRYFTLLFNIKYGSLIKRTVLLTRPTAPELTFKLQYWSSVKEFLQVEEEAVALVNVPNGAFLIKRLLLIAQGQQ